MTRVELMDEFHKKSNITRLLRGKMDLSDGVVRMHITAEQGNGILHSMIGCNILAIVPKGSAALPAGTVLSAYILD